MTRFIPYDKLSKQEKKKRSAERRVSWGALSPVTRRSDNPKAYKRVRFKCTDEDES